MPAGGAKLFSILCSPFSFLFSQTPFGGVFHHKTRTTLFCSLLSFFSVVSPFRRQVGVNGSRSRRCVWALFFFLRLRVHRGVSPARSGQKGGGLSHNSPPLHKPKLRGLFRVHTGRVVKDSRNSTQLSKEVLTCRTDIVHHVRVAYSLPRQAPTHTNQFPCASLVTPFILNSKTREVGVNGSRSRRSHVGVWALFLFLRLRAYHGSPVRSKPVVGERWGSPPPSPN